MDSCVYVYVCVDMPVYREEFPPQGTAGEQLMTDCVKFQILCHAVSDFDLEKYFYYLFVS